MSDAPDVELADLLQVAALNEERGGHGDEVCGQAVEYRMQLPLAQLHGQADGERATVARAACQRTGRHAAHEMLLVGPAGSDSDGHAQPLRVLQGGEADTAGRRVHLKTLAGLETRR